MKYLFSLFLVVVGLSASAQTIMNIYQNNGTVLQIPLISIDSITYTVNNAGNLATLNTLPIGNVSASGAVSGGNITSDGGTPVTQRGVCWSTSPNPTTANNTTSDGGGLGNYASNLTGLQASTMYYVRAYATNSAGTAYGDQLDLITTGGGGLFTPGPGVTDVNGNSYATIILNNGQEWMAENLRTAIYYNGDPIPNVMDADQWPDLTTGAWVHYENDSQYEEPYGKLYNWYAIADTRNVCPGGWHVPLDTEWTALTDFLGGAVLAGGKMKSTGTEYWYSPNLGATNESGFTGLPGGVRNTTLGAFTDIGANGRWWSATEASENFAWVHSLNYEGTLLLRTSTYYVGRGHSVRCVRD